jgi:2-phosphosulfolactate phosphatase
MLNSEKQLRVHFLPQFVGEHELAGSTVIVVDLLRASTTICHALAAGARDVVPFVEVDETMRAAAEYDRSEIVLGGERGGERIEGFDLGNSPQEYTPDVVFDRRVLFTTTNGTRALRHAHLAERVVVGAIVNLSAVVASVSDADRVEILCAGTGGHVTREDILAAGAMVRGLLAVEQSWQTNESADRARGEWEELGTAARSKGLSVGDHLAVELRDSQGGKNLLAIGHGDDLAVCAELDALDVVPELDLASGRVHLP